MAHKAGQLKLLILLKEVDYKLNGSPSVLKSGDWVDVGDSISKDDKLSAEIHGIAKVKKVSVSFLTKKQMKGSI